MNELEQIKSDLAEIKKRNVKVEIDKAWETSYTRRVLLVIFTYLSIGIYMAVIKVDRPWLNAIVPAIGFTLSTLSLPYFKSIWIRIKK